MVRDHLKARRRGPQAKRPLLAVIALSLISISILPPSPGFAAITIQDVRPLHPGSAIEGKLGRGGSHSYIIKLDANIYLRAAVAQRGVDIVLTLFGPGGDKIVATDRWRMIEGTESVSALTDAEGDYRLEVRASSEKAATGSYEIRIETLREATPEDRTRVAAERVYAEGDSYAQEWWSEPSLQAAIKKYEEAAALRQLAKDPCGEGDTLTRIADVYNQLRQFSKSIEYCARALALTQSVGDCRGETDTLMMKALTESALGDHRKKLELLDRMLASSRAAGDRYREGWALQYFGMHYLRTNEAQKALHYFSQSLALAEAIEYLDMQADAHKHFGLAYWMVGEYQKAIEAYEAALALWRALGNLGWVTTTLDNLGLVYEAMGEHQKALDAYAQTLAFRRAVGHASAEADTLTGMSKIHIALSQPYEALDHLNRALQLYEETENREGQAYALRNTGKAYALLSDHRKSLDYYRRALLLDRSLGMLNEEAEALAGIARAHRDLGDLEEARDRIESALQIIESLRNRLTSEQLGAAYFASKRDYYEFYIDLLMRMHRRNPSAGHDREALGASERARARGLLDLLAEARIDIRQGIAPSLKRREQELNARLSRIQSQAINARLQTNPDKSAIAKLEEELKRAESERQHLESEIRQKHHKYAEIHYPAPLRVEAVQDMLDEQTALLEYTLGREGSFLFVVSRTGVHSYSLPQASEINRLVEEARQALSRPGRRSIGRYVRAARQLYEALVAPAAGALSGKRRLLIAPDRALYYLPFEILLDEIPRTGGRADYSALPYMVRRWAISYIPSASVLESLRRNRSVTGREEGTHTGAPLQRKEIVAFGDPIYDLKDANEPSNADKAGLIIRNLFEGEERWELQRLRDSRREVAGIANSYKPEEVALYLGERASEENVKASRHLRNARFIHFAAHGLISERRPEHSGLVLTLGKQSKEDGLLQVYEIFDMKLNAELVVLSACRTGLGKEVRGEGVMGLMRAFMYAGASSVVVSQWQVADRSTADLMVEFYKRMNGSGDKTEALRGAKLEMIESGLYSHPYYWAPFVLVGEPN
ncbi:MAG: CHAT domain-containing protein [Blastocatellia bacterium]|nr:CHAT domain-containing protein [Blastocatellia bacterium]